MTASPHDEAVSAMLEVLDSVGGEIRLLGRLNDPIINNPSDRELFFLIPDLHLLSPQRQQHFGNYGFNHADSGLLARLLQRMAVLKNSWEQDNSHELITIQLGDFFDMWREFPDSARLEKIQGVQGDLRDILYRGKMRGKPCLDATLILGNHDTKGGVPLDEIPFTLKDFNRAPNEKPFLFVTHGDAFNVLEIVVPDAIKEFAVKFMGGRTTVHEYELATWGQYTAQINKPLSTLEAAITEPAHGLKTVTGAPKVVPEQSLPLVLYQDVESPDQASHIFFEKLYESREAAAENNLMGQYIRIVAIGHTHKASMVLCKPKDGGRPLLLMDVGAWIEKCEYHLAEGGEVTEPSAQLGVIHGNDARIYQIRIPAKG